MRGYDLRMHDGETAVVSPGSRQTHRVYRRTALSPHQCARTAPRTSIHRFAPTRHDQHDPGRTGDRVTGTAAPRTAHTDHTTRGRRPRRCAPEMRPIRRDATGCTPLCTQAMAAAHTHSPNDSTVNHTYTHRGPQTAPAGEATGPKVSSKRQRVSQP